MRHKEYIETCEICHKTYIATRKGSTVCSNVCRAQKSRDKHKKQFKTQAKIIEDQSKIIDRVLPRITGIEHFQNAPESPLLKPIIQDLSKVTGKDLTECKRPDGQHLYTDQDIRILLGRIIIETYNPRSEVALFNKFNIMDLIEDFEQRFKCRFDDVKKVNQHIQTGKTVQEHYDFAQKYAHLEYSNNNEHPSFAVVEVPDSLGRYCCKNCGGWFMPDTIPGGYNCLPGKRHEFLR